jgi:hypothetical protein
LRVLVTLVVLASAVLAAWPAQASHADGTYDIPVWFTWAKGELDVYIVPPSHGQVVNGNGVLGGDPVNEANPLTSSYLRATEDSIANWNLAIATYAPAWLQDGLVIRGPYVVGRDVPAFVGPIAQWPADIVIVFDETKGGILGVAVSGHPCIVDNSRFLSSSFTYEDMFNINGQEYGHCLGLNHVVDGHPVDDVMNGGYPYSPGVAGNPLNCISNLDVKGLEGVFAKAMGQPSSLWGANGRVAASQYAKVAC